MKFVDQIAQLILEKKVEPQHLTVILPSERAIKYISAALFKANGGPLIAPQFYSIDKWIRKNTSAKIIDKTRLLIKLFQIQKEHPINAEALNFEEFLTWGQTLLSDFDEIDRYLLDSKQVFKDLSSIKELESWTVDIEQLSETQKRFMEFWDRLPDYYSRLNEQLDKEKTCYIGKAYQRLADNIEVLFTNDKEHHFIFAGFNALSAAELSIITQLHSYGKATVLLNADAYYLDQEIHEAGMFQRKLMRSLKIKEAPFIANNLSTAEKNFSVIQCAQQTGQVKVAAKILNEISVKEMDETLVLLADETLIVPFIKNIPAKVGKANISLGLPFRNSPIKTWIELLFSIQENKQRYKTNALYHADLKSLWNHPFIDLIATVADRKKIIQLEQKAVSNNRVFRNPDSILVSDSIDELVQLIALPWNSDWELAMQQMMKGLQFILQRVPSADEFNQSMIETFLHTIQEFNNIVKEKLPEMSIRSFKMLFQQHWFNKSIAYQGNPIKGLQIMGLLETRLLDFKNLIIIGLNEGNLPPLNPINTLIPMDLRRHLNLPTPKDKQGLFAHHFYRLLHHSENIWATYSSSKEKVGSNEESRYLMQLQYELAKTNPAFKFNRSVYVLEQEDAAVYSFDVEKTPMILEKMDEKLANKTSASLLKKYLECPLDFFYRYIAKLGETQDIEEQMESNTMGSIIHDAMEKLYTPFCRHDKLGVLKNPSPPAITSFDIDNFLKQYDSEIRKSFAENFDNDPKAFSSGKNLLILEVALEMTKRFLLQEKKWFKAQTEAVFIEYLEFEISSPLEVKLGDHTKTINLNGIIDRVDSVGGKFRIVDYKTGAVKEDDLQLNLDAKKELLKILRDPKYGKHGLQLSIYIYLFKQKFGFIPDQVGIISFINVSNGMFQFGKKKTSLDEYETALPHFVQEILAEMYDTKIPFSHAKKANYCLYCEEKKTEKNF
ncbi:MAG: PD-(D/E)XK nuclease family protein [Bacteroidota bacterium]